MKNKSDSEFVHVKIEKTFTNAALRKEMKRWESRKIPSASCYQLIQLLTGVKPYLSAEGVYQARDFHLLAKNLGIQQQKKLIDLLCLSGSFFFICDLKFTHCYGFFSPYLLHTNALENYRVMYPEMNQIPVAEKVTKSWEMIVNQSLKHLSKEEKDDNQPEKEEDSAAAEGEKLSDEKFAIFFSKKNFSKLYSIYNIHNSYILTTDINQMNIPPSEDTLFACGINGDFSEAEKNQLSEAEGNPLSEAVSPAANPEGKTRRSARPASRKTGKKRREKVDYGDAKSFFHQMNEDEAGRNRFIHPHWQFISHRYQLSCEESRIVLIEAVNTLVIPHLDQSKDFRFRPPQNRIYQLNNYVKKPYYIDQLDRVYMRLKPQILAIRKQRQIQQIQDMRQNCPLSPFEWTHPTSLIRHYEDPVNGVVDLPAEAPPRPSCTARWNPFRLCWEEAAGLVPQPSAS